MPPALRKLVIQIPCLNEEATLPATVAGLPRAVPGFGSVEVLVVDDGSTDRTAEVARELGVDHVLSLGRHRGLAQAFLAGIEEALRRGADVVVNTDGDNQYAGSDVARLVEPILAGRAEIVVGARDIERIPHFSRVKKRLERLGSRVVAAVSGVALPDAASGFRAFSRRAARQVHVFDDYSHTLGTLIQAGQRGIAVAWVPVATNPKTRESRLARTTLGYVLRSAFTIGRLHVTYRPLATFLWAGGFSALVGTGLAARYLYFVAVGEGKGHVQSVVAWGVFLVTGALLALAGLLGDLVAANRKLLEGIDGRLCRLEEDEVALASEAAAPRGVAAPAEAQGAVAPAGPFPTIQ